jgi:hypothetical protein
MRVPFLLTCNTASQAWSDVHTQTVLSSTQIKWRPPALLCCPMQTSRRVNAQQLYLLCNSLAHTPTLQSRTTSKSRNHALATWQYVICTKLDSQHAHLPTCTNSGKLLDDGCYHGGLALKGSGRRVRRGAGLGGVAGLLSFTLATRETIRTGSIMLLNEIKRWQQRTSKGAARWPMSAHLSAIWRDRTRSFSSSGSAILSEVSDLDSDFSEMESVLSLQVGDSLLVQGVATSILPCTQVEGGQGVCQY